VLITARSGFFGLFLFFDLDHFPPLVMPAVWTYPVGKAHLAAIGALHQIAGLQRIVRPPPVAATL
jgi:hypothetical protein